MPTDVPDGEDVCEDCGHDPEDCADECRCERCREAAAEARAAAYECGG